MEKEKKYMKKTIRKAQDSIVKLLIIIYLTIEFYTYLPIGYSDPGNSKIAKVLSSPVILYFDAIFKAATLQEAKKNTVD